MMLLTLARAPASCEAMLPQKFSAATTAMWPPAPDVEPLAAGGPLRPQPLTTRVSPSASAESSRIGSLDLGCAMRLRLVGTRRAEQSGAHTSKNEITSHKAVHRGLVPGVG